MQLVQITPRFANAKHRRQKELIQKFFVSEIKFLGNFWKISFSQAHAQHGAVVYWVIYV